MPETLKRRHRFQDFAYWNLFAAVPLLAAGIAAWQTSLVGLAAFLLLLAGALGLLLRFFCTHCPHYIDAKGVVKCMFFWGMPKFFAARPGPLPLRDKLISLGTTLLLLGVPLLWLHRHPPLLIIFVMSSALLGWTLRRTECPRCIHEHCPANCAAPAHSQQG